MLLLQRPRERFLTSGRFCSRNWSLKPFPLISGYTRSFKGTASSCGSRAFQGVRESTKVNVHRRRLTVMSGAISATATHSQAQRAVARALQSERLFYMIAGSVMLIATAVGFRLFLAQGKGFGGGEITRQIFALVV